MKAPVVWLSTTNSPPTPGVPPIALGLSGRINKTLAVSVPVILKALFCHCKIDSVTFALDMTMPSVPPRMLSSGEIRLLLTSVPHVPELLPVICKTKS